VAKTVLEKPEVVPEFDSEMPMERLTRLTLDRDIRH
jgi:hypothetical protein